MKARGRPKPKDEKPSSPFIGQPSPLLLPPSSQHPSPTSFPLTQTKSSPPTPPPPKKQPKPHRSPVSLLLPPPTNRPPSVSHQTIRQFRGAKGRSLLHLAVKKSDQLVPILYYLLEIASCEPNVIDDDGRTPLCLSIRYHRPQSARFLLARKEVKVLVVDKEGNGLLHWFARHQRERGKGGGGSFSSPSFSTPFSYFGGGNKKGGEEEEEKKKNKKTRRALLPIQVFMGLIRRASDRGCSFYLRNKRGENVLHTAAIWGSLSVLSSALQRHAQPNVRTLAGETPLHLAVRSGNVAVARLLLDRGCHKFILNQQGLMASELLDDEEVVRKLGRGIKKMKELFLFSPLWEESKKKRWKGEGEGLEVDEEGMSIVHYAAVRGNLPLLEQLLSFLSLTPLWSQRNIDGNNPFQLFCSVPPPPLSNHKKYTHLLLKIAKKMKWRRGEGRGGARGGDVFTTNFRGENALYLAVLANNDVAVRGLVEKIGFPVDSPSLYGETTLHASILSGNFTMAELLLNLGGNPHLLSHRPKSVSESAVSLAAKTLQPSLAGLLSSFSSFSSCPPGSSSIPFCDSSSLVNPSPFSFRERTLLSEYGEIESSERGSTSEQSERESSEWSERGSSEWSEKDSEKDYGKEMSERSEKGTWGERMSDGVGDVVSGVGDWVGNELGGGVSDVASVDVNEEPFVKEHQDYSILRAFFHSYGLHSPIHSRIPSPSSSPSTSPSIPPTTPPTPTSSPSPPSSHSRRRPSLIFFSSRSSLPQVSKRPKMQKKSTAPVIKRNRQFLSPSFSPSISPSHSPSSPSCSPPSSPPPSALSLPPSSRSMTSSFSSYFAPVLPVVQAHVSRSQGSSSSSRLSPPHLSPPSSPPSSPSRSPVYPTSSPSFHFRSSPSSPSHCPLPQSPLPSFCPSSSSSSSSSSTPPPLSCPSLSSPSKAKSPPRSHSPFTLPSSGPPQSQSPPLSHYSPSRPPYHPSHKSPSRPSPSTSSSNSSRRSSGTFSHRSSSHSSISFSSHSTPRSHRPSSNSTQRSSRSTHRSSRSSSRSSHSSLSHHSSSRPKHHSSPNSPDHPPSSPPSPLPSPPSPPSPSWTLWIIAPGLESAPIKNVSPKMNFHSLKQKIKAHEDFKYLLRDIKLGRLVLKEKGGKVGRSGGRGKTLSPAAVVGREVRDQAEILLSVLPH